MEAFLDKKKIICTEQGKQDHLSVSNQQPGVPANHAGIARCEKSPAPAVAIQQDNLPSLVQSNSQGSPQHAVNANANTDKIDPLQVDLSACTSVVYEERNSIPGVKFTKVKKCGHQL